MSMLKNEIQKGVIKKMDKGDDKLVILLYMGNSIDEYVPLQIGDYVVWTHNDRPSSFKR